MDDILSSLQDVMQQELVAYKDILSKAKQKKEALLKNDVALLDRIVAHEWQIIKTVRQLEADREGMIKRIAQTQGMDANTISLADIVDMMDGVSREQFIELKEELTAVISEIDSLNRVNKGLVDTHLQYSAFCINLLTGSANTLNTYSYTGQISDSQKKATLVLDRMV
jgi:hypothetical protein